MNKKCKTCQQDKSILDFSYQDKKNNKRRNSCKVCLKKYDQKYNKSLVGRQVRKEYDASPGRQFYMCKLAAKRRNYLFDLTYEQFLTFQNKNCFYCNTPLEKISLDRDNNNLGYIFENLIPCCTQCNFLKGKIENKELFLSHIQKIADYQRIKNGK